MREWLRAHGATVGAFLSLMAVAALLSLVVPVPQAQAEAGAPRPVQAILLPLPAQDADLDTYADDVDRVSGDLQVRVTLLELEMANPDAEPYVLLGTQDDQWRTGADAELEWRHVIDPDSLGRKAGSPAWQDHVLRTGAWWMSRPAAGEELALAQTARLGPTGAVGVHWPQTLYANVRDDRDVVRLALELRDADPKPHALRGDWAIEVDVGAGTARSDEGPWLALPANLTLLQDGNRLTLQVDRGVGLDTELASELVTRWAPTLRFDSAEPFLPVKGEVLEQYHGFARPAPGSANLRTWDLGFDAGRDAYQLFLADFTGDGATDRLDAQALADLLAANPLGTPTVYAEADWTTDGQVVLQYWFLYLYNFVLDEAGHEIPSLAHKGDREFIQLTFPTLEAARNGTPSAIAFSQHYEGLRVHDLAGDQRPLKDGQVTVYVARGSHANFPSPGDDRRVRSTLTSLFDRFDGQGTALTPADYELEMLAGQPWHAGYNWGPVTRYARDLGVASKPLLQHDFRYPFTDPLWFQVGLRTATAEDLPAMYGAAP